MILADGLWAGSPAFVVGGGPSLKGFDWSRLEGKRWVGVNMAYRHASPTISFIQDARVYRWLLADPEWWAGPMCRVLHVVQDGLPERPHTVRVGCSEKVWGSTLTGGLFRGTNTGISAIHLADILGADPIYLLGFDMEHRGGHTVNFHDHYPQEWVQRDACYGNFLSELRAVAPSIRSKVVNLSHASAVDFFAREYVGEVL